MKGYKGAAITPENVRYHIEVVNGVNFDDFVAEIERQLKYDKRLNKSALARHFGKSRTAVLRWLPALEEKLPLQLQ
jgi:hypothetical protein